MIYKLNLVIAQVDNATQELATNSVFDDYYAVSMLE
jgi:hypothetical protein